MPERKIPMMPPLDVNALIRKAELNPLEQLQELGGCYLCPKDESGKRLGPLVGYAGRDGQGRQLVGDIYVNFALAEEIPALMFSWAKRTVSMLDPYLENIDAFLGAPRGGESFADKLAQLTNRFYLYPEKRVLELATPTSREKTELVFQRHQIKPGTRVAIVEDVMNNFTTTGKFIDLVHQQKGIVTVLVGICNRSPHIDKIYLYDDKRFPVIALVRRALPEYGQDNQAVADDVAKGNVVWKPKDEWHKLLPFIQKL